MAVDLAFSGRQRGLELPQPVDHFQLVCVQEVAVMAKNNNDVKRAAEYQKRARLGPRTTATAAAHGSERARTLRGEWAWRILLEGGWEDWPYFFFLSFLFFLLVVIHDAPIFFLFSIYLSFFFLFKCH